jgi:TetR/AcrR family transcriptional repressor of nem operon
MEATAARAPEKTRRKILAAAFDEFYKNGFQGSSLNRIVDHAGTTKGALFHHFNGKNDLGYAVVREVLAPQLKEHWIDPLAHSTDPVTDLKRIFRRNWREDMDPRQLLQGCPVNNLAQEMAPLDDRLRKALEGIYASWRGSVAAAFARGIAAGKVRKGLSPKKVAAFVVAAHAGMIGTAKNARDAALLKQTSEAFFGYLDSLKP